MLIGAREALVQGRLQAVLVCDALLPDLPLDCGQMTRPLALARIRIVDGLDGMHPFGESSADA